MYALQQELEGLPTFSPKCCIYRVPRHLQMINEGAYTPLVVSIGPLHHQLDHLRPTKIHKLKYLQSFLDRSKKTLADYLPIVGGRESEIRGYYADPGVALVNSEELISMVLVDAAFLIELFSKQDNPELIAANDDQMFHHPRMVVEVSHDIRLVENQLPFFILCELYDAAGFSQPGPKVSSFIDIVCKFLRVDTRGVSHEQTKADTAHFLDLLRFDYLPSNLRADPRNGDTSNKMDTSVMMPTFDKVATSDKMAIIMCKTATALQEAGVKFYKKEKGPHCRLLDIEFNLNKGALSIPKLVVQDDTEALFKNLAVFEQCHYFDDSYIIDYITFMDFLINTKEDVALLVKAGIIEHWLGSDERVADMFNGLSKHLRLMPDNFYYAKQCKQLDEYYNHPCNHHLAVLRQKYFNHPWATISVVYAILLLILTVLQAATGVIQILPKKSN